MHFNDKNENTPSKSSTFSKSEESSYMTAYMSLVQKGGSPVEVEKKLNEGVSHLTVNIVSDAVDGLFYAIFQKLPELNTKAQGMQELLTKYVDQKIDFSKPEEVSKIDDPTLRAFIGEVNMNHGMIAVEDEHYVVNPNMQKLMAEYGKYMSKSMMAMATFYEKEYAMAIFNAKTQTFNLDEIVNRILILEEDSKAYPNTSYTDWFAASKSYYYKIYFAKDNKVLLDSENNLILDLRNHYQATIKDHPDSQLAKDLNGYIMKLKKTNYKMTDDITAYLVDLTKAPESTQGNLTTNQQAQNNVGAKDPIQEALKANGK
jgi:hypothetical protein